jgi:hypothetical protein
LGVGALSGKTEIDNRSRNIIAYRTPMMGDAVQGFLMYSADAGATDGVDNNDRQRGGFSLSYAQGPLYAAFGLERTKDNTSNDDLSAYRIATRYTFAKVFSLGALFENMDKGDANQLTRNAYMVNAGINLSQSTQIKLEYIQAEDYDQSTETGAYSIVLGLNQKLGKTTSIYLVGVSTTNDDFASYGISQDGVGDPARAGTPGGDVVAFSIGVDQKF